MHYEWLNSRRSLWYRQLFLSDYLPKHSEDHNWRLGQLYSFLYAGSGHLYKCEHKHSRKLVLHLNGDKFTINRMINTDHSPQIQWLMTPKGDITSATRTQAMLPSGVTNCYHRVVVFFCKAPLVIGYASKKVNNRSQEVKGLFCIWGETTTLHTARSTLVYAGHFVSTDE